MRDLLCSPLKFASLLCAGVLAQAQLARAGELGLYARTIAAMNMPRDAAFLPDGRLVVVDAMSPELLAFAPDGTPDRQFLAARVVRPALLDASSISIAPDGRIVVADTGHRRVHVFDADATPLLTLERAGEEPFIEPAGVWAGERGIYVADAGAQRMYALNWDGALLAAFGQWGIADGEFLRPVAVAVDADGAVHVVDADRHQVSVFAENGTFLRAWGAYGPFPGQFTRPTDIEIIGDEVIVLDSRNHRVQVFSRLGEYKREWGQHALSPEQGEGKLETPMGFSVSSDGQFAALCEPFEGRIQMFRSTRAGEKIERGAIDSTPSTHYGMRCATGPQTLIMSSPDSQLIEVYDTRHTEPILVTTIGSFGRAFGRFVRITGLAFDESRQRLYVADGALRRIQIFELQRDPAAELKFDPTMASLVKAIDLHARREFEPALRDIPPIQPGAICLLEDGRLIVCDERSARVVLLGADLDVQRIWDLNASQNSTVVAIADAAAVPGEHAVAVLNRDAPEVFVLPMDGGEIERIRIAGVERPNEFRGAGVLALSAQEFMVSDLATHSILGRVKGDAPARWGSRGLGAREFRFPTDIDRFANDRIIVVDFANHRGQILEQDGSFVMAFGSRPYVLPTKQPPKMSPARGEN